MRDAFNGGRKSFQKLYDLFMVCYEGYFGFTASTLICIYQHPETIPIFSYSLFALYLYKAKYLWPRYRAALAAHFGPHRDHRAVQLAGQLAELLDAHGLAATHLKDILR